MALTLVFQLADTAYGLEIEAIQEIIEEPRLHFVPGSNHILTGAINLHGRILPVIDLPKLLGFPDRAGDRRLVVLTAARHGLALWVTRVVRIIDLDLALPDPPPADAGRKAVRGVVELDGRPLNLLDTSLVNHAIEALFSA